ncbi:E3 ubiquitin-protein ligase MBR2 isoform X3 [Vigna radiata var. radiata]|uniref:E3 ubiquitin-protein ligase MBR2 isoform X3 n=1 Tax=Vigna radiata var. radiata TaxID=3916 RepID=A0A3Q0F850_VIGRR|nr:E3 ubiquitin-protein ligase MBR2 isoform X3 [Vigna radiata var. radiata]
MQGQRRSVGSFPTIISMRQAPSSRGTDTNHQSSLNHVQNAVDSRFSDYRGSFGETAYLCSTSQDVQSFSCWNLGESSSRLNLTNQSNAEGLKSEHGLSSSYNATSEDGLEYEERQFEPNRVIFPVSSSNNLHGNQSRVYPPFCQGSSSNHITQHISLDMGHVANASDRGKGKEASSSVDDYNSNGIDREKTLFGSASCNYIGPSSENSGSMAWVEGDSSSSLVDWGPSCKRKALEGSSRQLCSGGSSSALAQSENDYWPIGPADPNASSNLSDVSTLEDIPVTSPPLLQNVRNEVRQKASNAFPLISIAENLERPLRNFNRRMSQLQDQESIHVNLPSIGCFRHQNHSSLNQIPSSQSFNDSLELRLIAEVTTANSGTSLNQSPAQRIHSFPLSRIANPRWGRSSFSYNSGDRVIREDFNLRVFPRDSTEHPLNAPASSQYEPTRWHTPSGNVNFSEGVPRSWIGSSSNAHPSHNSGWNFNHEVPNENVQSVSEFNLWPLFPSICSASGIHNGHSTPSSSGPPSFTQGSGNNQSYLRTTLLTERGAEVLSSPHSLQALTFGNEGRRQLLSEIRQVLMAIRRGSIIMYKLEEMQVWSK